MTTTARPAKGRRLRTAAVGVFVSAAAIVVQQAVYRAAFSPRHRTDFTVYTAAGRIFIEGGDVYSAVNERGWAFNGLPALAAAFAPFAVLDVAAGAGIFAILSIVLVVLALRAWTPLFPADARAAVLTAAALIVLGPFLSAVVRGQPSVPGLALAVLGLALHARGMPARGGLCLAAATVVKLFPIAWIVMLAFQGRGRTAAYGAGFLLLFLLLPAARSGFAGNFDALRRCAEVSRTADLPGSADPGRYAHTLDPRLDRNQSLETVLLRIALPAERLAIGDPAEMRLRTVARAGVVLWLIAALFLGRRLYAAGNPGFAAALLALPVIAASPVAWSHYFLGAAPTGAALGALLRGRSKKAALCGLSATILLPLLGHAWTPLKVYGATFFGGAAGWAVLVWILGRERSSTTAGGRPPGTEA